MTTFDVAASMLRGARAAGRQARAERRGRTRTTVRKLGPTLRRFTLTAGALAAFTVAAFTFTIWAGLIVAGLCALYLEQSLSDD